MFAFIVNSKTVKIYAISHTAISPICFNQPSCNKKAAISSSRFVAIRSTANASETTFQRTRSQNAYSVEKRATLRSPLWLTKPKIKIIVHLSWKNSSKISILYFFSSTKVGRMLWRNSSRKIATTTLFTCY